MHSTRSKKVINHQHYDLMNRLNKDSAIGVLLIHQWCKYKEENDSTSKSIYRKYRQYVVILKFRFNSSSSLSSLFSRQFDIYAADILDLYYDDDDENTLAWLNEKSNFYQDQIAIDLIDDLTPKHLIASQCMQSYAHRRWYGTQFHRNKSFSWEILVTNEIDR